MVLVGFCSSIIYKCSYCVCNFVSSMCANCQNQRKDGHCQTVYFLSNKKHFSRVSKVSSFGVLSGYISKFLKIKRIAEIRVCFINFPSRFELETFFDIWREMFGCAFTQIPSHFSRLELGTFLKFEKRCLDVFHADSPSFLTLVNRKKMTQILNQLIQSIVLT